ncbi:MAG: hypothetical protein ACHRHE_09620 [Tepidisphaerales bacterium]
MRAVAISLLGILLAATAVYADGASFAIDPSVSREGQKIKISFTLRASGDVEVAVLGPDNRVVRHLAAGVLGAKNPPPAPLTPALSQDLEWDGKDDFGKVATGGPFKVRVRTGTGVKFGRFIAEDPCNFGNIDGIVADEDGNLYIRGCDGEANQAAMNVRVFDAEGRYLREILPFPADLPPAAMKNIARWDEQRRAFFPRNTRNLNPDFYGLSLKLVSASRRTGVVFTDGNSVCRLDPSGRVPEAAFDTQLLWPKDGRNPNTGGGPMFLCASPDGQYLYLSGPFSSKTIYGHPYLNMFPPGRIYRMKADGTETMRPFVAIPVDHTEGQGGAWTKHNTRNHNVPEGPMHGIAVDARGNVYVADREHQRVAVFDGRGEEVGQIPVINPHQIAIHPQTGEVYVLSRSCVGYWQYKVEVWKYKTFAPGAVATARYEFPQQKGAWPQMALVASGGQTSVFVTGVPGEFVALTDAGDTFQPRKTKFAPKGGLPPDFNRLAVDFARDEIYISNGTTRIWRFNGLSGEGGVLRKDGKDFLANDLAVGYDGLLYTRVSGKWDGSSADYSGPFWRLDHELNPAPYSATGTHVLSPYIYSRYGIGFAERGLGVGPDGKVYLSFMYKWVAYAIAGFGPDGKPLKGKYLEGAFPTSKAEDKNKYPAQLDSAVIGPLPQGNANIRVDLKGNIYVGMMYRPREFRAPDGFEKDQGYRVSVGSVVKFTPDGGAMLDKDDAMAANNLEGAVHVYVGLAPFSNPLEGFGGNTCCVCRVPRFDLDRYGRLALPNAMTNSVLLYDNAGNLIMEFGKYGNFDSQYVRPFEAGQQQQGKPIVAVPEIPLAWPTGAGFSEEHIYVNDTYNRRVIRADLTWNAEQTREVH